MQTERYIRWFPFCATTYFFTLSACILLLSNTSHITVTEVKRTEVDSTITSRWPTRTFEYKNSWGPSESQINKSNRK